MPDRPKRFQSDADRAIEGAAAARERASADAEAARLERAEQITPVEFPVEIPAELTDRYEGEELAQMRERRPTPARFRQLERRADKHDDQIGRLTQTVGDMRETLGVVSGKLDVLPELVKVVEGMVTRGAERETVTFTEQVRVQRSQTQADIEVKKTETLAAVEITKAEQLDTIHARKQRRSRLTKIIGGVVTLIGSGAAIGELVRWIASHL